MSCGKQCKTVHVDPELAVYAKTFEDDMEVSTSNITMQFGYLDDDLAGLCRSWSNGDREITIEPEYWKELNYIEREELMYHELGHCAMNLDHNDAMIVDPNNGMSIEASIMNSYFFGIKYNWNSYRNEYKEAMRTHQQLKF